MSDKSAKGEPTPHRLILAAELHLMKTAGIIEVAVRNPNVAEYMRHWEGRALAAEAAIAAAVEKAVDAVLEDCGYTRDYLSKNATDAIRAAAGDPS